MHKQVQFFASLVAAVTSLAMSSPASAESPSEVTVEWAVSPDSASGSVALVPLVSYEVRTFESMYGMSGTFDLEIRFSPAQAGGVATSVRYNLERGRQTEAMPDVSVKSFPDGVHMLTSRIFVTNGTSERFIGTSTVYLRSERGEVTVISRREHAKAVHQERASTVAHGLNLEPGDVPGEAEHAVPDVWVDCSRDFCDVQ